MTATSTTLPFVIGRSYDEEMASDGESRYGAYVRDAVAADRYAWDMDHDEDRRHEFAALAWRNATGPVMSPGYVRYHHRIRGARVYRSGWDGALLASVTVATPPPAAIARLGTWSDWPTELSGGQYIPVDPYEEQIGNSAKYRGTGYALTAVHLEFPLPDVALPALPSSPDSPAVARTAAVAVGALVGALNDIVTPVIDAL
jgi:hypothetical protein